MRKLTRRATVLTAGLAASTAMGVAFAAWTSNGSGTGSAASTTSEDSVITGVAPVTADDLYPGATKSATVTITNPNDYPVVVTSIAAGASRVVNTDCAAATVRTDARALDNTGLVQSDNSTKTIAPNSQADYTLVLRMANDPHNACKSQTFVIGDGTTPANPLTATLRSAATAQSF